MREVRARYAGDHDIAIRVRFFPPDNRSDRVNFPNRMKPYFDGIADALGINDRRFLPSYEFLAPEKPGRVEVDFSPFPRASEVASSLPVCHKESGPSDCWKQSKGPDHRNLVRRFRNGS
ncbi:MAG: hypothetical protein RL268_163 [Pseudomonadota bacterium]|jgi:hypothetical protein